MVEQRPRDERDLWNREYSRGTHASREPDPFLLNAYRDFVDPIYPQSGRALDLAGGTGRHAVWLAERGWRVTVVDVSEVAMAQLKRNAESRGLDVESVLADLSTPAGRKQLDKHRYDMILVFFYLERKLFPALMRALKPGGVLIYKTYTVEQLRFAGGPRHPLHLLRPNELLRVFRGLRVLHYRETVRDKGVAEFVGWKEAVGRIAGESNKR